jgi:hypothetical protein
MSYVQIDHRNWNSRHLLIFTVYLCTALKRILQRYIRTTQFNCNAVYDKRSISATDRVYESTSYQTYCKANTVHEGRSSGYTVPNNLESFVDYGEGHLFLESTVFVIDKLQPAAIVDKYTNQLGDAAHISLAANATLMVSD